MIRKLQEKAIQRNPDEFSHKMEQKVTNSDGHVVNTQQRLRSTAVMKSQKNRDSLFMASKVTAKRKELAHERQALAAIEEFDGHKDRKHVIFVDTDKDVANFDAAEHFNTLPELVDRSHNRLTKDQLAEDTLYVNKPSPGLLKAADKAKAAAYQRLAKEEALLRDNGKT
eukprot:UN01844